MIADEQRAGHAVRVKAAALADAAVAEQYRLQPDLPERYGPEGRRYCLRDIGHHVQFLAASIERGNPRYFVRYVAWARGVMAAHNIAAADFLVSLRTLRQAAIALLAPAAADAACRHIDAALAAWPEE